MSDGLNDAEGTSWGRKIDSYLVEFEELISKILYDEPQLFKALEKRLQAYKKNGGVKGDTMKRN